MSVDHPSLTTFGTVTSVGAVALVVAVAVLGAGSALPAAADGPPAPTEDSPNPTTANASSHCDGTDLHVLPAETENETGLHVLPAETENETGLHVLPAETEKGAPSGTPAPGNDSGTDAAPGDVDSRRDVERRLLAAFDVGTCSGMPTVITEQEVNDSILNHAELTAYVVVHHDVASRERVYEYIQRYDNVRVERVGADTYEFRIRDGECCAITTISGTYDATTDSITVTDRTTERVPC